VRTRQASLGPEALIRGCVTLEVERSVVLFDRCDGVNQNTKNSVRREGFSVDRGEGGEGGSEKRRRGDNKTEREKIVVKDKRDERTDEWELDGGVTGVSCRYT
jgi:hypothetical protein